MAHVNARRGAWWLLDVLRETYGPQPRAKLDELADSLSARVLAVNAFTERDTARFNAAVNAFLTLSLAGSVGIPSGRAYDGTLDRTIRIHSRSPVPRLQRRALAAMLAVPGRGRALQYLRSVAISRGESARDAIDVLVAEASGVRWSGGPPTAAEQQETARMLNDLLDRRLVVNSVAREWLERWAVSQRSPK
jgi:hypothetical protein